MSMETPDQAATEVRADPISTDDQAWKQEIEGFFMAARQELDCVRRALSAPCRPPCVHQTKDAVWVTG